jgi:hypothetical protein
MRALLQLIATMLIGPMPADRHHGRRLIATKAPVRQARS